MTGDCDTTLQYKLLDRSRELRPPREAELRPSVPQRNRRPMMAELCRRAEARLRKRRRNQRSGAGLRSPTPTPSGCSTNCRSTRLNWRCRTRSSRKPGTGWRPLLEKYTDLYDFAPVGYFSLDEQGRILEVNLTGAALLGVERSRLINRRLPRFVAPASQPVFLAFLERVFAGTGKQVCEAALLRKDAARFLGRLSRHVRHLRSAVRGNGAGWRFRTSPPSSRRRRRNAAWRLWPSPTGS